MPPPPGLNEIHVRSLEDLQLKFLQLRIESPKKGPHHLPLPLQWWPLVGMGFIALVMTGNLARRRRLMHTAHTPFGVMANSSRLDSRSSRLLAQDGTSTRYLRYSEPTGVGLSGSRSSGLLAEDGMSTRDLHQSEPIRKRRGLSQSSTILRAEYRPTGGLRQREPTRADIWGYHGALNYGATKETSPERFSRYDRWERSTSKSIYAQLENRPRDRLPAI